MSLLSKMGSLAFYFQAVLILWPMMRRPYARKFVFILLLRKMAQKSPIFTLKIYLLLGKWPKKDINGFEASLLVDLGLECKNFENIHFWPIYRLQKLQKWPKSGKIEKFPSFAAQESAKMKILKIRTLQSKIYLKTCYKPIYSLFYNIFEQHCRGIGV